jgi:hypothetical protein
MFMQLIPPASFAVFQYQSQSTKFFGQINTQIFFTLPQPLWASNLKSIQKNYSTADHNFKGESHIKP